ncbi:phosphoribosyl-AMP cyclohydrolase, partial [Thermodesulfobacteriota bacterium]
MVRFRQKTITPKQEKMNQLDFKKTGGLIPAIVQDADTGDVLMMAYMNQEAWEATQSTRKATFWSRSRQELWVKGLTSGNVQHVKEIYIDCDNDAVLLKVKQVGGAACHTGYKSCFFKRVEGEFYTERRIVI